MKGKGKFKNFFSGFFEGVREFFYGKNLTCLSCGCEVFGGEYFCTDCKNSLPFNDVFCVRCGRRIVQEGYCADCRQKQPKFDEARSVFCYEGQARSLIYRFKNGEKFLANALSDLSMPAFEREFANADVITFVPMTKEAQRKRGYNQSELLAGEIARRAGKKSVALFEKVRDTREQKTLTKAEREKNLQGCFHLKERALVKGKRVLVVDDTLTTGATAETLAALLRGAKAQKVYLLTIASVDYKYKKL